MSAIIIRPRERKTAFELSHDFQRKGDYPGNGYSFDCDENGNLKHPEAMDNYKYAIEHPEEYEDMGIVKREWQYVENALARCECGEEIELYDEYLGACECPACKRWHNMFGQLLTNPNMWNDRDYDEDCI